MRQIDVVKYTDMSAEDQRTVDRWLEANLVIGSIFASTLCVMALIGSKALEPETAVAQNAKSGPITMPNYNESLSPYEIMIRMPNLPTQQVKDPF